MTAVQVEGVFDCRSSETSFVYSMHLVWGVQHTKCGFHFFFFFFNDFPAGLSDPAACSIQTVLPT